MTSSREVTGSPKYQGVDESKAYTFDWSAIGTPGVGATVAIKNDALIDKTTACITGAATIVGNTVVTGLVHGLTAGQSYRLECKVTISGAIYEAFLVIHGQE
jgi:hypothetical protein